MGVEPDADEPGVFRVPSADNRATVAMVYRAVDDLGRLTDAHFEAVKAKLDTLATMPARVATLELRAGKTDTRLDALERASADQAEALKERRTYRSSTLPLLVFTALGLLVSAVNIWVAAHA